MPTSPIVVQAQAAAAQALPWLWFGSLLLALMAAALTLRAAYATPRPPATASGSATAPAGLAIALGLTAFVLLAWLLGTQPALVLADRAFSEEVHRHASAITLRGFAGLTLLGDGSALALMCLAITGWLWRRGRPGLGLGLCAAVAGSGLVNGALKRLLAHARPEHVSGLPEVHGFGFPSGHVSDSVVFYGLLAWLLLRHVPSRWAAPVVAWTAWLVLLIAASRVVLDVHHLSDVLGGLAFGSAWLAACILVWRRCEATSPTGVAPQAPPAGSGRSSSGATRAA